MLICFVRKCSNVSDFNNRNQFYKLLKAFSKFHRRHFNVGLKTLLHSQFYGDLLHKLKIIVGEPSFHNQFKKIIKHYKRVGDR